MNIAESISNFYNDYSDYEVQGNNVYRDGKLIGVVKIDDNIITKENGTEIINVYFLPKASVVRIECDVTIRKL